MMEGLIGIALGTFAYIWLATLLAYHYRDWLFDLLWTQILGAIKRGSDEFTCKRSEEPES